jgi:hypothetical protein
MYVCVILTHDRSATLAADIGQVVLLRSLVIPEARLSEEAGVKWLDVAFPKNGHANEGNNELYNLLSLTAPPCIGSNTFSNTAIASTNFLSINFDATT